MISTDKLKQIVALAEKATPGHWYVDGTEVRCDLDTNASNLGIADCSIEICNVSHVIPDLKDHGVDDRQFIATVDPTTIKSAFEELIASREIIKELEIKITDPSLGSTGYEAQPILKRAREHLAKYCGEDGK